jgi:hypothetical protein
VRGVDRIVADLERQFGIPHADLVARLAEAAARAAAAAAERRASKPLDCCARCPVSDPHHSLWTMELRHPWQMSVDPALVGRGIFERALHLPDCAAARSARAPSDYCNLMIEIAEAWTTVEAEGAAENGGAP